MSTDIVEGAQLEIGGARHDDVVREWRAEERARQHRFGLATFGKPAIAEERRALEREYVWVEIDRSRQGSGAGEPSASRSSRDRGITRARCYQRGVTEVHGIGWFLKNVQMASLATKLVLCGPSPGQSPPACFGSPPGQLWPPPSMAQSTTALWQLPNVVQ